MKLKILEIDREWQDYNDKSRLKQFYRYCASKFQFLNRNSKLATNKELMNNTDNIQLEMSIDFVRSPHDDDNQKSGPVEIVIYMGNDPEFTDRSVPIIKFSLDDLIDEKIEMLDASNIQENKITTLRRVAARLNNYSHLLSDAIKRHNLIIEKRNEINTPLW